MGAAERVDGDDRGGIVIVLTRTAGDQGRDEDGDKDVEQGGMASDALGWGDVDEEAAVEVVRR